MAKGKSRRASAASSRLSIPELLNEAQRGVASAHVRYAKMLWELVASDAEAALDQLVTAMKWFATVAEVRRRWLPRRPRKTPLLPSAADDGAG